MSGVFELNPYAGLMSDRSIEAAMENGDLFIAPFDSNQLQSSGYNLTPTRCFYSTKKRCLLNIVEDQDETYVMIDRNDTVLVRTRESVAVSMRLAGAFYSKVKIVSSGFGHVSTTLDPGWEGQLLISLNNPTNRKIKFSIEKMVYGKRIYNSFVTLEFMGLNRETTKKSDNPPGRLDVLENSLNKNVSCLKRKGIEDLRILIATLHQYESESLEDITVKCLTEAEKNEYNTIYQIQDNLEFKQELEHFMESTKKKHLRKIRMEFSKNAEKSIELVNEYVTKKMKLRSIRSRVFTYFSEHIYYFFGVACVIALAVALYMLKIREENGSSLNAIITIVTAALAYIGFPILREILSKIIPG